MNNISIVITAFNRKEYLIEALKSIENQSISSYFIETIVVKNFLDDEIDEYIRNHNYIAVEGSETPLCDYAYQGILKSKGEFIFFLEDDDVFLPNKIAYVVGKMKELDLDFYHNSFSPRNHDTEIIKGKLYKQIKRGFLICASNLSKKDVCKIIRSKGDINLSSMCLNRRIIDNKFNKLRMMSAGPDWFLLFAALENGKRVYFDNILLNVYRIHNSTVNSYNLDMSSLIKKRGDLLQKEIFSLGLMKETFISPLIRSVIDMRIVTDLLQLSIINKKEIEFISSISKKNLLNVRHDSLGIGIIILYLIGLMMPRFALRLYFKLLQKLTFGT